VCFDFDGRRRERTKYGTGEYAERMKGMRKPIEAEHTAAIGSPLQLRQFAPVAEPEINFTPAEAPGLEINCRDSETNFPIRETNCPFIGQCAFFINGIEPPKTLQTIKTVDPVVVGSSTTPTTSEIDLIADVAAVDRLAAKQILRESRERVSGVTAEEIAEVISLKLQEWAGRKVTNGLLIRAIPNAVDGPALDQARVRIARRTRI
jgi:hypothetical protein